MSKAPAFQLYAADFYMDTVAWSATQVGVYFRLLMAEWVNGPLPDDINALARIAGLDLGNFKKCYLQDIAKKFTSLPGGGIVNLRLERTREEHEQYVELQREKGNKSAEKRWGEKVTSVTPRLQPEGQPEGNSSSSSSIKELSKEVINLIPPTRNGGSEFKIFTTIPLNDKTEYAVFGDMIEEWRNLYPKIDVEQTLRDIRGWNLSHPKERKTRRGIEAHINGWLQREQNRGGNGNGRSYHAGPGAIGKEALRSKDAGYGDGAPYPVDLVCTE